jgi:hypothetical protein
LSGVMVLFKPLYKESASLDQSGEPAPANDTS